MSVFNDIALASSVLDVSNNWPPEIFTSFPTDASISIPPAVEVNFIADSFVPWVLTISIVSDTPTFVVKEIALASSVFDDNFILPPEIFTSFPTDASISTPPNTEVNWIDDSSVPWLFVITIVSFDPWSVVNEIALASSVLEIIFTWPPDILISLPPDASISIPPIVVSILIESSFIPWLFLSNIFSSDPPLVCKVNAVEELLVVSIVISPDESRSNVLEFISRFEYVDPIITFNPLVPDVSVPIFISPEEVVNNNSPAECILLLVELSKNKFPFLIYKLNSLDAVSSISKLLFVELYTNLLVVSFPEVSLVIKSIPPPFIVDSTNNS